MQIADGGKKLAAPSVASGLKMALVKGAKKQA